MEQPDAVGAVVGNSASSPIELTVYEDTLHKVYDALTRAGLTNQQCIDAVFDMQNNGVYFREAKRDE